MMQVQYTTEPFDLEKAKKGIPVITREGLDVQVTTWDDGSDSAYVILGHIGDIGPQSSWTRRGKFYDNEKDDPQDLLLKIVPAQPASVLTTSSSYTVPEELAGKSVVEIAEISISPDEKIVREIDTFDPDAVVDQAIRNGEFPIDQKAADEARTIAMRQEAFRSGPHPVEKCSCDTCRKVMSGLAMKAPYKLYKVKAIHASIGTKKTLHYLAQNLTDVEEFLSWTPEWKATKIKIIDFDAVVISNDVV